MLYEKVCPECKKVVYLKYKPRNDRPCRNCPATMKERARKISLANKGKEYNKSNLGKIFSKKTCQKLSKSLKGRIPGFGGKRHSIETRQRMSVKRLDLLHERFGEGQISPWYNKRACKLFEEINSTMNWNGQHAERGGEVRMAGYFLDYYEPSQNLVIEFDEQRHEIPSIKEKDEIKQKIITDILNCKFVRIKDGQESNWKELIWKH